MSRDLTAILPDGSDFTFWETEPVWDRELHVCATNGCDSAGDGSAAKPFKSINAAAAIAGPGVKVLIHAGTYREQVSPPMGGESPSRMVSYEAAGDGDVIIKASEIASCFTVSDEYEIEEDSDGTVPSVWAYDLDPNMFHGYSPFSLINCLHEKDWLDYGRVDMNPYMNRRGMVFVDGKPLRQVQLYQLMRDLPGSYWVEQDGMRLHFRLPDNDDPKNHLIEISCREMCFAPKEKYLSYIRVKGLTFTHAANGAPVPQFGALSCRRGHHWIIEGCVVDWANTVGFDLGGEAWSLAGKPGRVIGCHIVRGNRLYDCGVCGMAGFASSHMLVEDNLITRTGWQHMELAWESAALKFHECVNSLFRRNIFSHCDRCDGIWLDCGNKNDRITRNLFLDIDGPHSMVYMECNRGGEILIDNNIIWGGKFYNGEKRRIIGMQETAGWNDPFDPGTPPGDGVHGDGTDDLHLANNLIGSIDGSGYSQSVVQFRLHDGRGGTSRNSVVRNNLFYDCRFAAMKLPNHDNTVDGNFYAKMPQGFLRIMYPAPSMALDLAAWRRFEGYDMNGGYASVKITVDPDALTLTVKPTRGPAFRWGGDGEDSGELKKVEPDPSVRTDFFGNTVEGKRVAGPFILEGGEAVFNIDPRKMKIVS